jgi:glutathione S-transferase
MTVADIAVFPFIRQFSMVDPEWFEISPYPGVRRWLAGLVGSRRFERIMQKRPTWVFQA